MEPQKFGRYEIKGELGRGGMATVYHAYDPRFEREVAIKVLPREMLHDPQFRTRFEREAKTIAILEHPAIVPVYDVGEEDGQPYFVMRYMTGGSLSDRLRKGPIPISEAARIFQRLAPALDSAHAKGIIHRDLKPGNILFDQYGEPYISDFGIAKLSESQGSVTGSAIVGTPSYMSPEQAQGGAVDGRADIYGMGVILFEMLSGEQPFQGDTPMSVVLKHVTEPPPHILDIRPELPPAVEGIVEKALAKDREQRFSTVAEMTDAMRQVARGENPDLSTGAGMTRITAPKTVSSKKSAVPAAKPATPNRGQAPGPAAPPKKKGGLWVGFGIVVVVLCVAAIGGAFLLRDKIPFLAGTQPTATQKVVTGSVDTPVVVTRPTETTAPVDATEAVVPTSEPTKPRPTGIGGADMVAFLSNNNVWVMNVDGTNFVQITNDGEMKRDLQWSPDGQQIFFLNNKCIQYVNITGGPVETLTCFTASEYVDAFEISPDGARVAISVDRILYVLPFDMNALASLKNHANLRQQSVCLPYDPDSGGAASKSVRWSSDGKQLAVNINSVLSGVIVDLIRVIDITNCATASPWTVDNFPSGRFDMINYPSDPDLPYYSWDGNALFLLNSKFRYETGYLYVYNLNTKKGEMVDPLGTSCCYSGGTFSPDGSYFLFAYQDINAAGPLTKLYYIRYGAQGGTFTAFELPPEASNLAKYHFEAVFRPVK